MSTNGRDVRIGDADREAAIAALGEHYAAGRLDKDEFDERSAEVWGAKTAAAIRPLFADLPQPHPPAEPRQSTRFTTPPRSGATTPPPRRRGFPVLPVLLLVLASVIVLGSAWPVFLVIGGLWFLSRSTGRSRSTHGWGHGCGMRSSRG